MNLSQEDKNFYDRIRLLSSIAPAKAAKKLKINDKDLYEICQYSRYSIISSDPSLLQRVKTFRNQEDGNSCLHIAAIYGNKDLALNLVEKKIIDANITNSKKETPIMNALQYN